MKYLSCFSGIGGLEASHAPVLLCEIDESAAAVLSQRYSGVEIWPDVTTLDPPNVDVVAGGWPCQDLSIAGKQVGLAGLRSGLLLDMLRVARTANAHTVVAENVPNILKMNEGAEFAASLRAFRDAGYPFVAWRVLNARAFGLPQNRTRLLLVASRHWEICRTLFRGVPTLDERLVDSELSNQAAGFYWTAGIHSINYSKGYVPTIKVGSSLGIASPPAVHYDDIVRTLSADEALRLQGFDIAAAAFASASAAHRAAGNAVARPVGQWVLDGLALAGDCEDPYWKPIQGELWADPEHRSGFPPAGAQIADEVRAISVNDGPGATNLRDFLDLESSNRLSARASRGLLQRLSRSGQACPDTLRTALESLATKAAA
jgi:DNA (cytosine-5)-methyltransferase 1